MRATSEVCLCEQLAYSLRRTGSLSKGAKEFFGVDVVLLPDQVATEVRLVHGIGADGLIKRHRDALVLLSWPAVMHSHGNNTRGRASQRGRAHDSCRGALALSGFGASTQIITRQYYPNPDSHTEYDTFHVCHNVCRNSKKKNRSGPRHAGEYAGHTARARKPETGHKAHTKHRLASMLHKAHTCSS